jgi:hypothetical protein
MTITELGDMLRANPCAWRDIPADMQSLVRAALVPPAGQAFTQQQRAWLDLWWLACTQEQLDAINSALPAGTRAQARAVDGVLYLHGSLLTDSLDAGSTYHAAAPVLHALVCTYIETLPEADE